MLSIIYGDIDRTEYGPSWFKYSYDPSWFDDDLVQQMILDVDKTRYISGSILESDVLGQIPPEKLSGGVQTLIAIYKEPKIIFDANSCGPNCAKWLLKIGEILDVTINLRYYMPLEGLEPFNVHIVNNDTVVSDAKEYALTTFEYI